MKKTGLLDKNEIVLFVVDIQDSLMKAIYESERVVMNSVRLIEAAKILDIPIIVTLQYASRLGGCCTPIEEALPNNERFDKMTFSCLGNPDTHKTLDLLGRKQALICGVETHVCINQTACELKSQGYDVHIAKDAVSSRTPENWVVGIEKMRDFGCVITSTETAIFELIRDASIPEFKKILPLVK